VGSFFGDMSDTRHPFKLLLHPRHYALQFQYIGLKALKCWLRFQIGWLWIRLTWAYFLLGIRLIIHGRD